nr:nuclear transport factor 2 family protein [Martelella alba]
MVQGRASLMQQFRGYVDNIKIKSADNLLVSGADNGRVVAIEYDIHGTILATGATYENRFCSIIALANRKITHWRDYMDSHAAWNALTNSNQTVMGRLNESARSVVSRAHPPRRGGGKPSKVPGVRLRDNAR